LLLLGIWRAAIHLCVSRRILAGIMFFFVPCFHLPGMASGCTPNETYVAPSSPFLALLL
jgi:hypothetical protein